MRSTALFSFILLFFVVALSANSSSAQSNADQVRLSEIRVEANRRVAQLTVQSYLPVRVGDLTTPGALVMPLKSFIKQIYLKILNWI